MAATMKAEIKRLKTLVTPDGVCAYPKLVTAAAYNDIGMVKYSIDVYFDKKSDEFKKFIVVLAELQHAYRVSIGKAKADAKRKVTPVCIKLADEKRATNLGIEVGTPYMKFATNGLDKSGNPVDPITVIGADGRPTSRPVYGTDLVCIETTIVGWITSQGHGIKGYLGSVQLLESRWSTGAGSSFVVRDEFIVDEDADDAEADAPDETGLEEEELDLDNDDEDDDDPAAGYV